MNKSIRVNFIFFLSTVLLVNPILGMDINQKKQISSSSSSTSSTSSSNAKIDDPAEINSISKAQALLQEASPQTLVVSDVDDTLIAPTEKMFCPLFGTRHIDESSIDFAKEIQKVFRKFAASKDDRAIFSKIKFVPVEQSTVGLIKALQACNIKVIALTDAGASMGNIEFIKKWRLANLNQIGLNFGDSFEFQEMILDALPPAIGFSPIFYKGTLFSAGYPKGKVLAAFLEKIGWTPHQVIFFDDCREQCESVACEMKKMNIPCHSFWYRAVACKGKIKLDQTLIKKQLAYWAEHKEILETH